MQQMVGGENLAGSCSPEHKTACVMGMVAGLPFIGSVHWDFCLDGIQKPASTRRTPQSQLRVGDSSSGEIQEKACANGGLLNCTSCPPRAHLNHECRRSQRRSALYPLTHAKNSMSGCVIYRHSRSEPSGLHTPSPWETNTICFSDWLGRL
ncbi:hypothetical protein Bbelb_403000 [Branchiostoma belcheri]|nr:hypothetical protein Bbelb_403000 [Branchiostoma belcheri]